MSRIVHIALGGNLGDRRAYLDHALECLRKRSDIGVRKVSRYYESSPIGGPGGQGAFLNAAAELATTLDPFTLLALLQAIENDAGRQRRVRWGERTLDLDLLLFENVILNDPRLIIPHPRFALRRFALVPLAEIAPKVVEPLTEQSIANLLANLERRPSSIAFTQVPPNPDNLNFVRAILTVDSEEWRIMDDWHPALPSPRNPTFALHYLYEKASNPPPSPVPVLCLDPANSTRSLQAELRATCDATRAPCEPIS